MMDKANLPPGYKNVGQCPNGWPHLTYIPPGFIEQMAQDIMNNPKYKVIKKHLEACNIPIPEPGLNELPRHAFDVFVAGGSKTYLDPEIKKLNEVATAGSVLGYLADVDKIESNNFAEGVSEFLNRLEDQSNPMKIIANSPGGWSDPFNPLKIKITVNGDKVTINPCSCCGQAHTYQMNSEKFRCEKYPDHVIATKNII